MLATQKLSSLPYKFLSYLLFVSFKPDQPACWGCQKPAVNIMYHILFVMEAAPGERRSKF